MNERADRQAPDAAPRTSATVRRLLDADRVRSLGILLPFIALFVALSFASSAFLTKVNLLEILDQQSSTLIVAAAGTLVLVAGGSTCRWVRSTRCRPSSRRTSRW